MAKITVGIGMTLPISEEARSFIRPEVRIADIDTDGDIAEQLEGAKAVTVQVWDETVELLYGKTTDLLTKKDPKARQTIDNALGEMQEKIEAIQEVLGEVVRMVEGDGKVAADTSVKLDPEPEKKERKKPGPKPKAKAEPEKTEKKNPGPKPKAKKTEAKAESTEGNDPEVKMYPCKICGNEFEKWKDAYACKKSHNDGGKPGAKL